MREEEIKKMLQESTEGPSFDFVSKTMRRIEAMENSKKPLAIRGYNSVVAYLVPVFMLVLLFASYFSLDSFKLAVLDLPRFSFDLPVLSLSPLWIAAAILISLGFWLWLWWEKKYNLR